MQSMATIVPQTIPQRLSESAPSAERMTPPSPPLPKPSAPLPLKPPPQVYQCPMCRDMKWLIRMDSNGLAITHGDFNRRMIRCNCQYNTDRQHSLDRLTRLDGLTPGDRTKTFETMQQIAGMMEAAETIQDRLVQRRGLVTLRGEPGRGKSYLLMAAINRARSQGVLAVYTTTAELLDHLRRAYAPESDTSLDARWDMLINCEVLALDELDRFKSTEWAEEKFGSFMDLRYRYMDNRLTLCAMNGKLSDLPSRVASRLNDGRARVIEMRGIDVRRVMA